MSDACVNTDMIQFRGWFFVSTRPRSQRLPRRGVSGDRRLTMQSLQNSMPRKCVVCIQTVNEVLIIIFPHL
jgi:hypothetical protein